MCSGGREPELAVFLFTYSYAESPRIIEPYHTSMERSFRGESNGIGCKKFGGELTEDVGNYLEMNQLAQIRDISAFLFRLATRWTSLLRVECSLSILIRFWLGLECFGG